MASNFHEYPKMEFSKMSGKDPYQVRDSEGIMCAITLSHNSSHTSIDSGGAEGFAATPRKVRPGTGK